MQSFFMNKCRIILKEKSRSGLITLDKKQKIRTLSIKKMRLMERIFGFFLLGMEEIPIQLC